MRDVNFKTWPGSLQRLYDFNLKACPSSNHRRYYYKGGALVLSERDICKNEDAARYLTQRVHEGMSQFLAGLVNMKLLTGSNQRAHCFNMKVFDFNMKALPCFYEKERDVNIMTCPISYQKEHVMRHGIVPIRCFMTSL